ncbi:MAG: hypothetical protein EBY28_16380 [Betaproteobacteria bacterium]|nr:hypothetical protein [Betaproteobacteria bacterium]
MLVLAIFVAEGVDAASIDAAAVDPPDSVAQRSDVLNADVRQDTISSTICVAGYTASIRPSSSYTQGVKFKLMQAQSIPRADASGYELDHRIPLALGGHPRALANLSLQPWDGERGAKKKDRLERALQRMVCNGTLALDQARDAIFSDWEAAYRSFMPQR